MGVCGVCLFAQLTSAARLQYTDRLGTRHQHRFTHTIPPPPAAPATASYEGNAVRKAILLARYVNFVRAYLHDARTGAATPSVNDAAGIPPAPLVSSLTTNLTKASPMSAAYLALTDRFERHFNEEAQALDDKLLAKELALLQELKTKGQTPA